MTVGNGKDETALSVIELLHCCDPINVRFPLDYNDRMSFQRKWRDFSVACRLTTSLWQTDLRNFFVASELEEGVIAGRWRRSGIDHFQINSDLQRMSAAAKNQAVQRTDITEIPTPGNRDMTS
jgi:hypothetical protein